VAHTTGGLPSRYRWGAATPAVTPPSRRRHRWDRCLRLCDGV